jgi:hypothetical protein
MAAANAVIDRVRQEIRGRHYSLRTEKSYSAWVRRFLAFHRFREPSLLGAPEVRSYLTHLAVRQHVSASTQNQAFTGSPLVSRKPPRCNSLPLAHLDPPTEGGG